jgi:hypothetical protein
LIFPNLLAIDEAKSIDIAAMMLVVKKMVPNFPSVSLNLSKKKNVIQDLDALVTSHRWGEFSKHLTWRQVQMQRRRGQIGGKD